MVNGFFRAYFHCKCERFARKAREALPVRYGAGKSQMLRLTASGCAVRGEGWLVRPPAP